MRPTRAHIINHTHWDREWFLTSVYTNRWIPRLIDRLDELAGQNPDYRFCLDGQTLVIEDLLQTAPHYREKVEKLRRVGNLLTGPYYCQPDWQLTGGEALLRNLLWGRRDMGQSAGSLGAGWLVDTFGHISQAPQLHRLFGIETVYIWRGAPRLEPFFQWLGPDGSRMLAINLFGGYRNLYGVTHTPELAVRRLQAEVEKLRPYYPGGDVPLFDGYDLEDNPEDPVSFYREHREEIPPEIQIIAATPMSYAGRIRQQQAGLPVIAGELTSGKYGAVFPGTLSTRTYLKLLASDCERLLYQVCEPLGTLAYLRGRPYPADKYEAWSRSLLQNAVHDCICGVSIDLVHEKMEYSYRQLFEEMQAEAREALQTITQDFTSGVYAVSANPFPYRGLLPGPDGLYEVETRGIGVWKAAGQVPLQAGGALEGPFRWKNEYYEAQVLDDGRVQVGEAVLGALWVYEERGDAYSDERGACLGALTPAAPPALEQGSEHHRVLRLDCSGEWAGARVWARLRLTFDRSPLIRWEIELDSRGTDFRVEMDFETAKRGQVRAGMPFDVVARPFADRDLLPRQAGERLGAVLLGQRELGEVRTFPFHEFVAVTDESGTAAVFARGLHAYEAGEDGRIRLTLRRSVEWLTRPDLEGRVGDAGPFFYVPDARCERKVIHEVGFALLPYNVESTEFLALNAGFQGPPLLVRVEGRSERGEWAVFQENLPLSSLHVDGGWPAARAFNPTSRPRRLSRPYPNVRVTGETDGTTSEIPAKAIVTLRLDGAAEPGLIPGQEPGQLQRQGSAGGQVEWLNPPRWRVGPNQGLPDPAVIEELKQRAEALERRVKELEAQLAQAAGQERYLIQHQVYVAQRELLEYRLSQRLNESKLERQGELSRQALYDAKEEIAAIGYALNQLRIRRRIFDYVAQVAAGSAGGSHGARVAGRGTEAD